MRRRNAIVGSVLTAATMLLASACSSGAKNSAATTPAASTTASSSASPSASSSASGTTATFFGPDCAADGVTAQSAAIVKNLPVSTVAQLSPVLKNTLTAATVAGLLPTLNSAPALTIFAPTDAAFAKEPPAQLQKLLTDPSSKPLLVSTLKFHVLSSEVEPSALAGKHVTSQGQSLTVTGSGESYVVNGTAKIVCGGIQTKNAVVYIIDSVLHPSA